MTTLRKPHPGHPHFWIWDVSSRWCIRCGIRQRRFGPDEDWRPARKDEA